MVDDEMVTVSAKVLARLIEAAAWVVKENRSSILGWREVPAARMRELEQALREPLEGEAVGDRLAPGLPPAYDVGTDGTVRYSSWDPGETMKPAAIIFDPLADRFGGLEIED